MLICITGKSNSGKGYVANLICEEYPNTHYLDVDKVGHRVNEMDEVKKQEVEAFGEQILEDGKINRRKLANIVFNDENELKKLEDITWPYMEQEIDAFIEEHGEGNVVLDWFRIPDTKYFNMSKLRILVEAPYELRLQRAMQRNAWCTKEIFDDREKNSWDYTGYDFTHVINNENTKDVKMKVRRLI